jgi:hypothetical protein
MVPKSRTIKSSSCLLKPLKVPYDTFFLESGNGCEWRRIGANGCEWMGTDENSV